MIKVIKQKRKTITIKIDEFNNITIKAPVFLSDKEVEDFIKSKEDWIEKHTKNNNFALEKYRGVLNKEKALYFGKIINNYADFKRDIMREASVYLVQRTDYLSKLLNYNVKSVKIKNYKSRWGSIDRFGNVSLNYKLIMLDKSLIDYVIIHELCHTVHFNHKKEFHALIKSLIKNETELRKDLKQFSFLNKIY